MYCTSVLFQCIRLQSLHTRKKGTVCHRGVLATPGDMPCLVCFVNQLFINLGIPSITCLFSTNSATMLMTSDVIYSWLHHALSNKNILKSWLLSTVQISWFVYHLVSLAKDTHSTEANILLGWDSVNIYLHISWPVGMSVSAISPLFSVLCPFP